jgi:hypothetical protein
MAYNPAQPRQAGKFSGPGTQPAQAAAPPRPTPAALAQARKVLAQRTVQAQAQARLTPKQRAQKREHDLALRLMAAQKRTALAKVRRAQALLRSQEAQRAHAASSRASAVAAGAAAGQRAPEGRTPLAPILPGSGPGPSSQVQANLRRYLAGRGGA